MFDAPRRAAGPRPAPLAFSLAVHAAVLLSVIFPRPVADPAAKKTLYQEVFQPNEKKLIWYRFSGKLPNVLPAESTPTPEPPRADVRHPQTIVSDLQRGRPGNQMARLPLPEADRLKPIDTPNLMAFAGPKLPDPPRPTRAFTLPPDVIRRPVVLPDAPPLIASALPDRSPLPAPRPPRKRFEPPSPRPHVAPDLPDIPVAHGSDLNRPDPFGRPQLPVKPFTPPVQRAEARAPELPAAPDTPSVAVTGRSPVPDPKLPVRAFSPPPARASQAPAPLTIPSAPLPSAPARLPPGEFAIGPFGPLPRPQPPGRAGRGGAAGTPSLPDAPEGLRGNGVPPAASSVASPALSTRAPARAFMPPPARRGSASPGGPSATLLDDAPVPAGSGATLTAVVIDLHPSSRPDIVLPDASRRASLAAGPTIRKDGGPGVPSGTASIVVPGLTIQGGPPAPRSAAAAQIASIVTATPTSRETLASIARSTRPTPREPEAPLPGATRVSSAPDRSLDGRIVYLMAIQMPNVTSASGSWLVWFAERGLRFGDGDFRAPAATRKVDPIYPRAAMEEGKQGKVRLAAILGKDGRIGEVTLLHGVDARLDAAAIAALRKWEFLPAMRGGAPVEVDAIVEIPFALAPLDKR